MARRATTGGRGKGKGDSLGSPPSSSTEYRFIAKSHARNGAAVWGVYDRKTGSWPLQRPGIGVIHQDHSNEVDAMTEALRLEEHYRKESS